MPSSVEIQKAVTLENRKARVEQIWKQKINKNNLRRD